MSLPRAPIGLIAAFVVMNASPLFRPAAAEEPPAPLPSTSFIWSELKPHPTDVGERREVCDQPTRTLRRFECHISTLNPGLESHPQHQHAQEEFIILKEGALDVVINGVAHRIGPGSLFFFASNDWHSVNNVGETPATYLVFNYATAATATAPKEPAAQSAPPGLLASAVYDWAELAVRKTAKGERRDLFDSPTVTARNLECHATTIHAGLRPHDPHRHPDEEIIVVKEGALEATVEGKVSVGGPGSIFFFASGDEHGLRNVGDGDATYYVFRIVSEATPES